MKKFCFEVSDICMNALAIGAILLCLGIFAAIVLNAYGIGPGVGQFY